MSSDTWLRCHSALMPLTLLSLLLLLGIHLPFVVAQCGPSAQEKQDRQNKLALYKVTLKTYWSRARFPRHYPDWKPPAQFGKLVGRTHDATYTLYRLGERLSSGVRQYVETGRTDGLDTGGEFPNILQSFIGPSVPQGEGTSIARAFLDGNHSLISVVARINPSPDWFIGVDSFQLCVEGNWVDTVTVELDPLDGGTDNGFTFTAANWPTQPQGIAYRITSRYPAHPAGSFFYPNLPRLPPIATLTFTKLREYTLTETYHEDEVEMEFVSNENLLSNNPTPRGIDPNRDLNEVIAEERGEMDTQRYSYWPSENSKEKFLTSEPSDKKAAIMNSIASSYALQRPRFTATSTLSPVKTKETKKLDDIGNWSYYRPYHSSSDAQKAQIFEDIQRKITSNVTSVPATNHPWRNSTNIKDHQHRFRPKHHKYTKGKWIRTRLPRDCKVSEWGPWSACSRTCGVGETQRTRKVVIKPRRGGIRCPPLKETKWCSGINPCHESSQSFADTHRW